MLASTLVLISPATATGESISVATTAYSPGNAANIGISLSGFDQTQNYQVTVKFVNTSTNADVTNGTLAATQGSTSLISGYSSYSAAKLGFKGTYSAISAALSSMTWNPNSASGDISIRIGIASAPGVNEFYDANSAHYYKFIPAASGLGWVNARTAAENMTLFGLRGYLTEIRSAAENSFIGTETSAVNVWIGASDRAVEGTWIWDGATDTYAKPLGSGSSALGAGVYSSWASGEPNDHISGGVDREDCAVTNWQSAVGMWNDLPCSSAYAYLVEFGGRPNEVSTASGATFTTTVTAVNPTVISVPAIGGVTVPTTGGTPVTTVTTANGYSGTVTWAGSPTTFASVTSYTATITLTALSAYTLTGVTANFFTVAGATSVTHNANSGVITAVFPATPVIPPAISLSASSETVIEKSTLTGYTITSTGGPIASYSISPAISNTPGLSFNTATGLISGTPTAPAVSRIYTITATNATASASRAFAITVEALPPSVYKVLTPSKISRDLTNIICTNGTYSFMRYGSIEETPKLTTQKYLLVKDGVVVETVETSQSQVSFNNKDAYLNSTLSCSVQIGQEGIIATTSSLNSKLISTAQETERVEIKRINAAYYADTDAAYAKKNKEFARITQIKADELAVAKTPAAIALASTKYREAFTFASAVWKYELSKASAERDVAREAATKMYLDTLEKAGVSIYPRRVTAIVMPTPPVAPKPSPTPTATSNPQPSQQMVKVGTVYMGTGSYFLNDATKESLRAIANTINASGAKNILVYGHADNRGGVNNTVLSQNRAKAVANYLRPLLTSKKISIGWYSSSKPVSTGTTAADLAQNRRVEIYTK